MLSGDLADAGLVDVLFELADAATTGCVHLAAPSRGRAQVFLLAGRVYAVTAADEPDGLVGLLQWPAGTWRLRLHERSDAGHVGVDLLAELTGGLPGPGVVPSLSAGEARSEVVLDSDAWSMLGRVDGVRTVAELARAQGLTTYAAAHLVDALVAAGVVDLTHARPALAAPADVRGEPDDVARSVARVAAALTELFGRPRELDDAFARPAVVPEVRAPVAELWGDVEPEWKPTQERPPGPTPEPEPEPEPGPEPEPRPGPEPTQDLEPTPAPEPTQDLAPTPEPEPTEDLAPTPGPGPTHDRQPEPEPDVESTPAPMPGPEREPEPVVAPEGDPQPHPDALAVAAFSSELSAAANSAPVAEEPHVEFEPPPPAQDPGPVDIDPADDDAIDEPYARKDTDTASLMRELSSLGLEDDLAPSPPLPRAPAPAVPAAKKKGLFGR